LVLRAHLFFSFRSFAAGVCSPLADCAAEAHPSPLGGTCRGGHSVSFGVEPTRALQYIIRTSKSFFYALQRKISL
jgi:hypothetical protein